MEDKRLAALMKYVRREISFAEWIESGVSTADADDIEIVDGSEQANEELGQYAEENSSSDTQEIIPAVTNVSAEVSAVLAMSSVSTESSESVPDAEPSSTIQASIGSNTEVYMGDLQTQALTQESHTSPRPLKMTDLLLEGSAAESAKKVGGTGVDEFMKAIPMARKRRAPRRKTSELPQKFKQTMGRANILWARGEIEQAKGVCMELIRQVPKCSEPFQTLGLIYEEQEDQEKALQFFLIAAYLNKSGDVEEWLKLAGMSLEQHDLNQALTCYNQALKLEPENLNILWDRAALSYQIESPKKALEYYELALKAVPLEEGAKYIDLASEMAKLYHQNNFLEKAVNVLEEGFSKYPQHVTNPAINMLADLHMTSNAYDAALQMMSKHCHIKKEKTTENTTDSPLTTFSQFMSPNRRCEPEEMSSPKKGGKMVTEKWIVPEDLPIDLRIKIVVCLIHSRQLHVAKDIVTPLFLETAEDVGDLYIDVAEAYAENGDCDEALPILDMLVTTKKFSLAGVWLRKAECLNSLGRLEEAALAYARVVSLAPNHLDARLTLATLHQQLGRPNQALDVLNNVQMENLPVALELEEGIETSPMEIDETLGDPAGQPQDFRLLFHRCALLQSQNRTEEFLAAGLEMYRLFLSDVYYSKDLAELALMSTKHRREHMRSETSELEESRSRSKSTVTGKDDTGIRNEEWWEMFKQVVSTLSRFKRHSEARHLVFCGLCSDRFPDASYQSELIFMSVVALYLCKEYRMAFDAVKLLIGRQRNKVVFWNLMSRITAKTEDLRHHRYVLRLLIKHPDELPMVIMSGHNAFVSGSYRFAIGEYIRAFRQAPDDPLITLCLAIQYVHLACQRFPRSRHSCVVQGVVFLFQYMGLRGECQEVYYNIGRAFHQLGLLQFAVHYYNKALEFPLYDASTGEVGTSAKFSEKHDLHRETAFNLSLIYRASGNEIMAKELLMKHCWV